MFYVRFGAPSAFKCVLSLCVQSKKPFSRGTRAKNSQTKEKIRFWANDNQQMVINEKESHLKSCWVSKNANSLSVHSFGRCMYASHRGKLCKLKYFQQNHLFFVYILLVFAMFSALVIAALALTRKCENRTKAIIKWTSERKKESSKTPKNWNKCRNACLPWQRTYLILFLGARVWDGRERPYFRFYMYA